MAYVVRLREIKQIRGPGHKMMLNLLDIRRQKSLHAVKSDAYLKPLVLDRAEDSLSGNREVADQLMVSYDQSLSHQWAACFLSLRLKDIGHMHDFLPLLNAIGSSLKDFGIWLPPRCDFKEYRRFSGMMDAIPIIPNMHVEHIFVSGFERRDPSFGVYNKRFDGAEFVACLLMRLSAPQRLRTVTINKDVQIMAYSPKEFPILQWHNWRAVDDVLAEDSF
ncbi:hypothetical protein C8J57DRAFT_1459529 [Mycena rebaudengoi]|nr:hypothetical protein C8J57DRAFT_1459529 [Mycena rebaudengoi]